MVIGGDKFCGNSAQWADVKTEIVSATANAGFSQITEMGTALFQIAGSGEHSDESSTNQQHIIIVSDKELSWPLGNKQLPTQFLSVVFEGVYGVIGIAGRISGAGLI